MEGKEGGGGGGNWLVTLSGKTENTSVGNSICFEKTWVAGGGENASQLPHSAALILSVLT